MNYDLAKKLKDAGFPIKKLSIEVQREPMIVGREAIFTPTLSELIEACGESFINLEHAHDGWIAFAGVGVPRNQTPFINGDIHSTPEEAVANLWLALNKK